MKRLFYLALVVLTACLVACSTEEPVHINQNEPSLSSSSILSPEEAISAAERGFEELGLSKPCSRSISNSEVYLYSNISSRNSNVQDSLFYIVNIDGGGYAVVVALREFGGYVIGISEEGYFDVTNENLSYYMEYLSEMYSASINIPKPNLPLKPTPIGNIGWGVIYPGGNNEPYPESSINDVYHIPVPTKWGQESPYNSHCPYLTFEMLNLLTSEEVSELGGRTRAGCVPVAIGQIAAYLRKPSNVKGKNLNWDKMLQQDTIYCIEDEAKDQIAYLLRVIGDEAYARYGISTGCTYADAYYASKSVGFENVRQTTKLDDCYNSIISGSPVAVFGQVNNGGWIHGRHCWVADGYIKITYRRFSPEKNDYYVTRHGHKLHFNWGWDGRSDGYFDVSLPFQTNIGEYSNSENDLMFIVDYN